MAVQRTSGGIKYDTAVKEVSQKSTPMPTPTKSTGSGDAKIAASKAASSSNTQMETPAEYHAKAEAAKAAAQQPQPVSAEIQARLGTGMAVSPMMQQASKPMVSPQILTGALSSTVYTYPSPVSPDYAQRVQMGALAAGIQDNRTASELRRDIVQSQGTIAYIPGQPSEGERLRELDRLEAAKSMQLGKYENKAAAYERSVASTLMPLTSSGYKSARFVGGVAEGIAYAPVAIPRTAVGLATNPAATVRETVLGPVEQIIADPARGTGQLTGMLLFGKGVSKGAGVIKANAPAMTQGAKALARNEAASVNYWQVKYDFTKPRVTAAESTVPQIKPGEGLVSGRQYSGLNPILEARIRSQGATPGVKALADMTALERFQASQGNIAIPKSNLDISAMQRYQSKGLIDKGKPSVQVPRERLSIPEIEPSTPRIVGIKRTSGKPLSEAPESFFTPRKSSADVWQAQINFKPAQMERSAIPQLQPTPKVARAKPLPFKEPVRSPFADIMKQDLQAILNRQPESFFKTSVATSTKPAPMPKAFPFAIPKASAMPFNLPRTAPMASAFSLSATSTAPFTDSMTATRTASKTDPFVMTATRTASKTDPFVMPASAVETLTYPGITPRPITAVTPGYSPVGVPPLLVVPYGKLRKESREKKNKRSKSKTTFEDIVNPIADWQSFARGLMR
jgi:hypothetical protein